MATFDEVAISVPHSPRAGGAVLYLARSPRQDAVVRLPSDVEVEVRAGMPALVVRGIDAQSYERVLELALDQANQGLDVLAMRGIGAFALADHDVKHVVLWSDGSRRMLRIWSVTTLSMHLAGTVTVVGAAPSPPSVARWDESFRYFRHSQATDDLFDAFRNLYLALESVLSEIAPVSVKPPSRLARVIAFIRGQAATARTEGENVWLRRALAAAHLRVPLMPFTAAKSTSANAAKKLARELREVRNGVFHAKRGVPLHVPYGADAKKAVGDALGRLGRLYVALAGNVFGVQFGTGGFTLAGFQAMLKGVSPQTLHLSDDPSPFASDDQVVNPAGGKTMPLHTRHDATFDAPFFAAVRGEATGQNVTANIGVIRRVATTFGQHVAIVETLERALGVDDVDVVEIVLGTRGMNVKQLRTRYAT